MLTLLRQWAADLLAEWGEATPYERRCLLVQAVCVAVSWLALDADLVMVRAAFALHRL